MAYKKVIYDCGPCKDYEYTWAGNYGAKGETRAPRKKPTPEQIEKQNQRNKEKRVRREMLLNFHEGDYWITLKYQKGYRPSTEQVKKDFKNFRDRLGRRYRSRGQPLKYIYRLEIGKQGGVHIHFLVNDIGGTDKLVAKEWKKVQQSAGVYFAHAYEEGGFQALAEYVTKKPKGKALEQLSLFPEEEQKQYISYNGSRNLIKPVPDKDTKECRRIWNKRSRYRRKHGNNQLSADKTIWMCRYTVDPQHHRGTKRLECNHERRTEGH